MHFAKFKFQSTSLSWSLTCLFLFFFATAKTQIVQNCTPFQFEIVKVNPNLNQYPSTPTSPDMRHVYYQVNLKTANGQPLPAGWKFDFLSLYGHLSVNNFTSKIDLSLSQSASQPGGVVNPYLQYLTLTEDGDMTWTVGTPESCNEPGFVMLTFSAGNSVNLFTVAVQAGSGDDLSWDPIGSTVCDAQTYNCTGTIPVVFPALYDFPAPTTCSPPKSLDFALEQAAGLNNITVKSSNLGPLGSLVRYMDGVIHIQPSMNGITALDFAPSNYPPSGPFSFEGPIKNADGSFDVYFYTNTTFTLTGTPMNLFFLQILGQYNLSQGGDLICSVQFGRIVVSTMGVTTICALTTPGTATLTIPGYPACLNKLKVTATRIIGANCEMSIDFNITHTAGPSMLLSNLKLCFYFEADYASASAGTPVVTGLPCSACWTLVNVAPKKWKFTYENTSPLLIPPSATVSIPFTVDQDCIKYYVLYAEANTGGGSGCSLNTEIDLNQWPACDPKVYGQVFNDLVQPPPHHKVILESTGTSYSLQHLYDSEPPTNDPCDMAYSFCPDVTKQPFQLRAELHPNYANDYCGCGVTTLDLALISKHILGIEPLGGPLRIIAADANKSGSVTAFDILVLRKCLLGLESSFSAPPWWYIRDSWQFPNPLNPFTSGYYLPNSGVNISPVPANGQGSYGNFFAVKVGDVNTSCECDDSDRPATKDEVSAVSLRVPVDQIRRDGNTIAIPVYSDVPFSMLAAQAGFRFDPQLLTFKGIVPNEAIGVESWHFGAAQAEQGELRFGWSPDDGQTLLPGQARLFTLQFECGDINALPAGEPLLWTADRILKSEVYDPARRDLEIPLRMQWSDSEASSRGAALNTGMSVGPNPTNATATAYITMPSENKAILRLANAEGQILATQSLALKEGENAVDIQSGDYPPGVFTIILEAENGVRLTRRLVKF